MLNLLGFGPFDCVAAGCLVVALGVAVPVDCGLVVGFDVTFVVAGFGVTLVVAGLRVISSLLSSLLLLSSSPGRLIDSFSIVFFT